MKLKRIGSIAIGALLIVSTHMLNAQGDEEAARDGNIDYQVEEGRSGTSQAGNASETSGQVGDGLEDTIKEYQQAGWHDGREWRDANTKGRKDAEWWIERKKMRLGFHVGCYEEKAYEEGVNDGAKPLEFPWQ